MESSAYGHRGFEISCAFLMMHYVDEENFIPKSFSQTPLAVSAIDELI